jgi:ketosteroid isomerase-like protein
MKRKGFFAATSLGVSLLLFTSCQPANVGTNNAGANNDAASSEAVNTPAIEAELLRIENDWPRVMKEKDGAAVRRVLADDVVLIYPDGSTGTREEDAKGTENGMVTAESVETVDLKVNVLNKDTAVVTGRTIMKNAKLNPPYGKQIDISGEYRFVDTFARRNNEWKLVAGASVPVQTVVPAASPGASPAAKASPAVKPSPAAKTSPAMTASPTMKAAPTP